MSTITPTAPAFPLFTPPATGRLLLTADRVWDGASSAPIEFGFVLIEGQLIAAVGRLADLGTLDGEVTRVDLTGATVLPGLINAHVHLTFDGSADVVENYQREAAAGLGTLTERAVHNLESAARVGVTTVRDLGTLDQVAFAAREAVADGRVLGSRVLTSGRPITVTGGHCHWFSHQCDTPEQVRDAVRAQAAAGADVIKIFAGGGNLTPGSDPLMPQYEQGALAMCVREAHELDLPVTAHAHAPEVIRRAVAAGVDGIEHASFEVEDGVMYLPQVAEAMARGRISFCPTWGVSFRRLPDNPAVLARPAARRFIARLPGIRAAQRRLHTDGVALLAGSDAGVTLRPFDDYPADVATLVGEDGLGLSPRQALTAATSTAADLLALGDTGRLCPGRRADLLAVDGDPLTDIADLLRTRCVLLAGRPVPLSTTVGIMP